MKSLLSKFRIFMFLYWAMMLSFSGMYVMYITNIGFTKNEISIAVIIYTVSSLIGQCFIGYLVDKLRCISKILMFSISLGLVVAAALIFAKFHWQVYLIIFVWGFFLYGTVPLSEAWCIENLKAFDEQRNFGKIRGVGSIGYGISAVFLGALLQKFGWEIYYWYIIIGVLCALFSIYILGTSNKAHGNRTNHSISKVTNKLSFKEALREITKIKPLMSIVITIFLYNFVLKGIYSYLGLLVSDLGGGPLSLGFTYFFDATPEVVTFFIAGRLLKKFGGKKLIFIAFILQIIRLALILVFNSTLAVILLGTLSGFAFGMLATAYKTYIYELAPAKYKVSCMSVCESIIGLASVISAPVFGVLFTKTGTSTTILVSLIIYIVLLLVMAKNLYMNRKQNSINA